MTSRCICIMYITKNPPFWSCSCSIESWLSPLTISRRTWARPQKCRHLHSYRNSQTIPETVPAACQRSILPLWRSPCWEWAGKDFWLIHIEQNIKTYLNMGCAVICKSRDFEFVWVIFENWKMQNYVDDLCWMIGPLRLPLNDEQFFGRTKQDW